MIEYLESLDRAIVLTVNSWNTPFLDELMWWISARITWVPLYLFLFYLAYEKLGLKGSLLFLALTALTIFFANTISVYALKETLQRYRPSHNLLLAEKLHYYRISATDFYQGGQYGFVSSHATNFFVITTTFSLVFYRNYPKITWILLAISILVCFSRLYLGVHYLSDLLAGAFLGAGISYLTYRFVWRKIEEKFSADFR